MKRMLLLLLLALTFAAPVLGQRGRGTQIRRGPALPSTCKIGQVYIDTDATGASRFSLCKAVDTWQSFAFVPGEEGAVIWGTGDHTFDGEVTADSITTSGSGPGQFQLVLTSDAAITTGELVKVATTAERVIKTVTTDTDQFVGFAQTTVGSAGLTVDVALVGQVDDAVADGVCNIGDFVIVGTTTDGRVECTGTFTAGLIVGKALTDSTAGNPVKVLIQMR